MKGPVERTGGLVVQTDTFKNTVFRESFKVHLHAISRHQQHGLRACPFLSDLPLSIPGFPCFHEPLSCRFCFLIPWLHFYPLNVSFVGLLPSSAGPVLPIPLLGCCAAWRLCLAPDPSDLQFPLPILFPYPPFPFAYPFFPILLFSLSSFSFCPFFGPLWCSDMLLDADGSLHTTPPLLQQRLFAKPGEDCFLGPISNATFEVIPSPHIKISGLLGCATPAEKKGANVSDTTIGLGGTTQWRMPSMDRSTTLAVFFDIVAESGSNSDPSQVSSRSPAGGTWQGIGFGLVPCPSFSCWSNSSPLPPLPVCPPTRHPSPALLLGSFSFAVALP